MSGTGPGPDDPGWAAPAPPPAPPAPEGPGWSPPPPRRRKGAWLFVLVPMLVVFVAGVVFAAVEVFSLIVRPIDATNEYLADIRARRYEAAYARSCTYGFVPSLERFVAGQRENDAAFGPLTDYDITSAELRNGGARTEGTWTRGGQEQAVAFRLHEEDGVWKVCGTVSP